jgi:hypothetical protein
VPLRATTIRFDDAAYTLIREEARDAGVSFSQFVRESALIRAAVRAELRRSPGAQRASMAELGAEVERLARVEDR